MSTTTQHDYAKLPKWAQRRIENLERSLAAERERLTVGPESNTFADPYSAAPQPLGTDTPVQFVFSRREDGSPRAYVQVNIEGDRLRIYGSDGALSIRPESSNVVSVKLERW